MVHCIVPRNEAGTVFANDSLLLVRVYNHYMRKLSIYSLLCLFLMQSTLVFASGFCIEKNGITVAEKEHCVDRHYQLPVADTHGQHSKALNCEAECAFSLHVVSIYVSNGVMVIADNDIHPFSIETSLLDAHLQRFYKPPVQA